VREHEALMPTASSPSAKHLQTPESKCSRTKSSGICLGLEAVAEANRYMQPHGELSPPRPCG